LVIGVSGRLIVEQKRVDRLPAFCTQLEQLGLDYRLELLGEGPERPWLERHLPTGSKVVFHGRKSGEEYWRILNAWDVIFFVSDYEGTPISMLEAMAMGAIPVFPRVGCGGDAYVAAVRPDLLYSAGDLAQAARTCQDLSAMQDAKVAELRERSRATVAGHLGESYLSGFAAFFLSVKNKPRISGNPPARPWPKNDLPLKWLAFLGALRRSFRKSRTN
jgi:glycosyltransferase involved in cell wall biosynthesis